MKLVLYRLWRLRRLIILASLPPLAVAGAALLAEAHLAPILVAIAVAGPLVHAVAYPRAWLETLVVGVTLVPLLGLAATVGPEVGPMGLLGRLLGLGFLFFVFFTALSWVSTHALEWGALREVRPCASRRSRLPVEALRAALAPAPDRDDGFVRTGPADDAGVFEVTVRHRMASPASDEPVAFPVSHLTAVESQGEDHVQFLSLMPGEEGHSRGRLDFAARPGGSIVTYREWGGEMTGACRLGFWLQDHMADYLVDVVDRAEGRALRANRFQVNDQMIVGIGRWFARFALPPSPGEGGAAT